MSIKCVDIVKPPAQDALEQWKRWKNHMASIAVKPRKRIKVQ